MPTKKIIKTALLGTTLALTISGCTSRFNPETRMETAINIANKANMKPASYAHASPFTLQAFEKIQSPNDIATLYIEGDGLSWITRSQPSGNPTPLNPLTLDLAAIDPAPNVIYLGRACHYIQGPACQISYWTDKRFAPEIINSTMQAIDEIKTTHHINGFHLVGYSGGGGIAGILAAKRSDILSLRTLAGNMDIGLFTSNHDLTPMNGSINPSSTAAETSHIPQIHYIGEDDSLIDSSLAEKFVSRQTFGHCARITTVPDTDHKDGWKEHWAGLVHNIPRCKEIK